MLSSNFERPQERSINLFTINIENKIGLYCATEPETCQPSHIGPDNICSSFNHKAGEWKFPYLIVSKAQSIKPVTPKLWRPSWWCASCSITLIQAFASLRECEYIAKIFATLLRKQSSGRVAPTIHADINSVDICAKTYSNGCTSKAVNSPSCWVSWWKRWIRRYNNLQWRTRCML